MFLFEYKITTNTWEITRLETSPKQKYEAARSIEIQMLIAIVREFHQAVIQFYLVLKVGASKEMQKMRYVIKQTN